MGEISKNYDLPQERVISHNECMVNPLPDGCGPHWVPGLPRVAGAWKEMSGKTREICPGTSTESSWSQSGVLFKKCLFLLLEFLGGQGCGHADTPVLDITPA